jgi:hypothetical protein
MEVHAMARKRGESSFSSALFREAKRRDERNRKRRAARLKAKPARDEKTLKRKVDYVAQRMAGGASFSQARKEVGLSKTAFDKGTRGAQFFERGEGGKVAKDDRGRLRLNRNPTIIINREGELQRPVVVGQNAVALREWQKALSVRENHKSSPAEITAANTKLRKLSKQSIVDIAGNRVYPASDWDTIESGFAEMDSEDLDTFNVNRYRFTGGGL